MCVVFRAYCILLQATISLALDWPSRPIRSLRYMVTCTRIRAQCTESVAFSCSVVSKFRALKCITFRTLVFTIHLNCTSEHCLDQIVFYPP